MTEPAFVLKDIFSSDEINTLKSFIQIQSEGRETLNFLNPEPIDPDKANHIKIYSKWGRQDIPQIKLPTSITSKIQELINQKFDDGKYFVNHNEILVSTYSNKYGTPTLQKHKDGGNSSYLVDYQLDSNTSWDITVDGKDYPVRNNEAVVFNAVEFEHARPVKKFLDNEFITMIYFRLTKKEDK